MKSSGTPQRRCILAVLTVYRVVALQIESGASPTHITHQQSQDYQGPGLQKVQSSDLRSSIASGDRLLLKVHEVSGVRVSQFFQVPTASVCIVSMCFQIMVVYTALALCRTYHELTHTTKGQLEAALRAAAQTLTYGPMLCALFIGCQMRVERLSDESDEPQAWVQKCMSALSFAVVMSTLLVLVIQSITGKPIRLKENPFDIERPFEHIVKQAFQRYKTTFHVLTGVRYLFLFGMYAVLAGLIWGICSYLPPTYKRLSDVDAISPAVMFTMILTVIFFSTQLIIAGCRTISEHTRIQFPQVAGIMHATVATVDFAPALAVLFLAAHMRAVQHGAVLEDWVHNCMMISTGSLCAATLLAIVVPLTLCGVLKQNPWTNEFVIEVPRPTLGYIFVGLRYICLLGVYLGAAGVMLSIYAFEAPGTKATMPVSSAVQCVVNLTCQFSFVYFLVTLLLTASEMTGGTVPVEMWSYFSAIESARSTVAFAPVLSILFIATDMHALAMKVNKGVVASWINDGMYLATWSLQMTAGMCLAVCLFAKTKKGYDGTLVSWFSNRYIGIIVVGVRYISMLLLYSGIVVVIVGLTTMTPAHASISSSTQSVPAASATALPSGPSR